MLAGMSRRPTYFTDVSQAPSELWTYEKDGMLILLVWIIQCLGFLCCCFFGLDPIRVKP